MATTVYTSEEIVLQDGKKATLKPLPISSLRKFIKVMEGLTKAEDGEERFPTEEEWLNTLLNAGALCLSKEHPEYFDSETATATEEFEDAIDTPTLMRVLEVCGGFSPKEAMMAAATQSTTE